MNDIITVKGKEKNKIKQGIKTDLVPQGTFLASSVCKVT